MPHWRKLNGRGRPDGGYLAGAAATADRHPGLGEGPADVRPFLERERDLDLVTKEGLGRLLA